MEMPHTSIPAHGGVPVSPTPSKKRERKIGWLGRVWVLLSWTAQHFVLRLMIFDI